MQDADSPLLDLPPDTLTVARRGPMLVVTIARPDRRNALSRPTIAALGAVFARHAEDPGVLAAAITGMGDKSFAAGGDLKDLDSIRTRDDAATMSRDTRAAFDAIRAFPVPVVAALNGDALGGGAELAVACDFRVAAAHARIGFVQGRLGITTAWGGGPDLIALVGAQQAKWLGLSAQVLSAPSAAAIGLIDSVASPDDPLMVAVDRLLAPILTQPRQVLTSIKALNRAARAGVPRAALDRLETDLFAQAWISDDHWAAVDAFNARKKP